MFIFIIPYVQRTLQPIRSFAYSTLGQNANNPHQINTQKCNFQHIQTSMKFAKLVDPIGMKMPNFMPLCIIIILYQEFKEKSTFLHDTA